ncbi:MAG: hypothetical protein OSB10_08390, partial [Planctomycetota bacterium]|nr:hypothetical protein [Planctomycetota bacterium]
MQKTSPPLLTQTGAEFLAEGQLVIQAGKDDAQAFKDLPLDASPAVAAAALDVMDCTLNQVTGRIHLYSQVHPDPAMREVAEALERELSGFLTELSLDREMYDRVAAVDLTNVADEQIKRLFEHSLRGFRSSGVDRDPAERKAIADLKNELVGIGQEFDRNINTGGKEFLLADGEAGLEGLPADFIASHP